MNSARSNTTTDKPIVKLAKHKTLNDHLAQSTLNTSRQETQTTNLSPKHQRPQFYYKEGDLIKGAKAFTSNINNRFGTSMLDNRSLIQNTLNNRNLQESYDQMMRRSDAISKYYNQDFQRQMTGGDELNQSKRSMSNGLKIVTNPSPSKLDELSKSLSKSRDLFNEVFVNDEELAGNRSGFQSPQFRVKIGVFGQFNVNVLPQVHTAQNQNQKRLLFRTMDRLQSNNTKTPYTNHIESRAQTGTSGIVVNNNHIKGLNEGKRGQSVTETLRTSRDTHISNNIYSSMNTNPIRTANEILSMGNGEAIMTREKYLNKNFLTAAEKKYGNSKNLDNINKSFSKLNALKDRNWSQRDITKSVYASPSNFGGSYNTQFNQKFNSILSSNKMKKNLFSTNEGGAQNSDFKRAQASYINQMVQLKKQSLNPYELKQENSLITSQLNTEQKQLYGTLREGQFINSNQRDNSFSKLITDKGSLISPKIYSPNQQSLILWEAKERAKQSPMGMQPTKFDIISMKDKLGSINELKNRVMLKKVNGISQYAQDTHITAPNYNKDYQKAFQQDNQLFRRGQGMLSKFANSAASHKLIMPAFKKA